MHTLTNALEKQNFVSKHAYRILLLLLSPFAPHIAEELNEKFQLGPVLAESAWPKYDAKKLIETKVKIAVQVNGKLRGLIIVEKDEDVEAVKAAAFSNPSVSNFLEGKDIIKTIVVPNRIVNIVAK